MCLSILISTISVKHQDNLVAFRKGPRIAVWRGGPPIHHIDGIAGLRDATSRAYAVGRDRPGHPIDFAGYG